MTETTRKKYKAFYDAARTLKKECPTKYPVHVRTFESEDVNGDCRLVEDGGRKKFIIRVSRGDLERMLMTLVHEMAHALVWDEHSPEWARAYSKCYKVVYEAD